MLQRRRWLAPVVGVLYGFCAVVVGDTSRTSATCAPAVSTEQSRATACANTG
jgi:hypothetical protein